MWYPRTSGIWQTVWAERVGATYIDRIRWTPEFERWEIGFEAFVAGEQHDGIQLKVKLSVGDQLLVNDTYVVRRVHRRIALSDPALTITATDCSGAEQPNLIDAEIQLWYGQAHR